MLSLAALLLAPLLPQQRLDPSRLYPVTAPVRHAGTLEVTSGRWTRSSGATKLGSQVVYDNTCTWAGGFYYATFDWCEDAYDEGRIPSPSSPAAPAGAQPANRITSLEFGYCTDIGPLLYPGGYAIELAFWDKLGGDCVGNVAPTPPPVSASASAYFDLIGLGLPGSTAYGFTSCWLVNLDTSNTGFVLGSDGDGSLDGTSADDSFVWMIRQNTTYHQTPAGPAGDGFFVAGDPAVGAYGACTYDIPCGGGATPCGTGLDTTDGLWINVDGVAVGSSASAPAGCNNSIAQYGQGTNCYFFGGYPANPLASLWLRLESDGRGSSSSLYCQQGKPTSVAGCTSILSATDLTLATGTWSTTNLPRDASLGTGTTVGIYVFTDGVGIGQSSFSANTPFGTLCMNSFKRSAPLCPAPTAVTVSGLCNTSALSLAVGCNGGALGIAVGEDVNVQCWYRDPTPANPGNANFTNALFYTVQ